MDLRTYRNCKVFQFRSYDVWGNEDDGYDINDIISCGIFILENDAKEGTEKAWKKAIRESVFNHGARVRFNVEWLDETMIEITMKKDGFPVGRFELIDNEDFRPDERWFGAVHYTLPTVYKVSGNRAYSLQ